MPESDPRVESAHDDLVSEMARLMRTPGLVLRIAHDDADVIFDAAQERSRSLQDDMLLTLQDLAFLVGYSEGHVKRLCADGTIPAFRLGDEWRCSLRYFRQWIAERSGHSVEQAFCVHGFAHEHWLEDLTMRCPGP